MLEAHERTLKKICLYQAIRNVQFRIPHSSYHLSNIFEMYNSETGLFFTPIAELDFSSHEIFDVSTLLMQIFHMGSIFPQLKS